MADEMNLATIYESQTSARSDFLDEAERVAKLTIPSLRPKGDDITEMPYTHVGTQAVRSLASYLVKLMLPAGVRWAALTIPPERMRAFRASVESSGGDPDAAEDVIQRRLEGRTIDIHKSLALKLSRARAAPAVRRNLVEGSTLGVNTPYGLYFYPLRSFVVDRDAGQLRAAILKEISREELQPVEGRGKSKEDDRATYTLVRYPWQNQRTGMRRDDGEVWRQKVGAKTASKVKDEHWRQYFVVVSEIPDCDPYPSSYTHAFVRLLNQINHMSESLGEAASAAAFNKPIIRPGSTAAENYGAFVDQPVGQPWIGETEDFSWVTAGIKIGDWAFVVQLLTMFAGDVGNAFALGIKDRPRATDAAATTILQMIDELNTQTEDLHTAYEETFQVKLFESEFALHEMADPLFDGIADDALSFVDVSVSTGTSVLAKQQALLRFVGQFLPIIQERDRRLEINAGPVVEAYTEALPFPTNDFYTWRQQDPAAFNPQDPAAQAQAKAASDGPRSETVMTPSGPQPPQPPQNPPPQGPA